MAGSYYAALADLNSLHRPDWSRSHKRSTCLHLPSSGVALVFKRLFLIVCMVCVCVLRVCKRSERRRQACCNCILVQVRVQSRVSPLTFCLLSQSLIICCCVVYFKVAGSGEVVWWRNGFSCADFQLTGVWKLQRCTTTSEFP